MSRKIAQLKRTWRTFRRLPVGQRFQGHHGAERRKDRARPTWLRVVRVLLIPLFIAIGLVLTVIPGPAILFFLLAAALLAAHSMWIARALDRTELRLRAGWAVFRNWRNRPRTGKPLPRPRASH